MSINVMNRVWETSQHKGGALNLMLAIADFADDDGNAFPGVPRLAKKIRMTERNTQLLLRKLEESGELMIKEGAGPRGTNRYRIILDQLGKRPLKKATTADEKNSPPKSLQGEKTSSEGVKNLQGSEREGGESQITRSIMDPPVNDPPSSAEASDGAGAPGGGDGVSPLADWLKREFGIVTAERFSAYPDAATRAYVQRLHDGGANARMIAADLAKPATRRMLASTPPPAAPAPPLPPPESDSRRPGWISPEQWQSLTDPQRDALALAQLVNGRVEARYPDLTETIYKRWSPTIQRLIQATGESV